MFGIFGNDVFRLEAGDFVAGEYIDGGPDTDEIWLENAGIVDLSLVGPLNVLNIETIRFVSGESQLKNLNLVSTGVTKIVGSSQFDSIELAGAPNNDYSTLAFETWTDGIDIITIRGRATGTALADVILATAGQPQNADAVKEMTPSLEQS